MLDRPLGLAWLTLAAEHGETRRQNLLQSAWQKASPAEKLEAARIYQSLRARYGDVATALRVDQRFRRELAQFRSNPVFGTRNCISGTMTAVAGLQPGLDPVTP